MPASRLWAVLALGLSAGLGLSACAGGSVSGPPRIDVPTGVRVSILQYRSDYVLRRIQIKVTNDGARPVTVVAARLESPTLTGVAAWISADAADETVIRPGTSTDLPALLPAANCPSSTSPSAAVTSAAVTSPTVRLDLRAGDGSLGRTGPVPVADPFRRLGEVNADDCRRAAAVAIADIVLVGPLRTRPSAAGLVGRLDLRLTPTGRPGVLRLDSIDPTTLLTPATGRQWRIDRDLSAESGPQSLALDVRPARCDLHAIAEDKLGTVLQLTIRVDGGASGLLSVAADPELRAQLQNYVAATCAAELP